MFFRGTWVASLFDPLSNLGRWKPPLTTHLDGGEPILANGGVDRVDVDIQSLRNICGE